MGEPTTCRHCGQRIVLINFAMGPRWQHQPAGAAFQDGMHEHCKRTRAEPRTPPAPSTPAPDPTTGEPRPTAQKGTEG